MFFAGDLMFWHHAIESVGAGLATVLGNLQVIIVGVVAWLLFGERPSRTTLLARAGRAVWCRADQRGRRGRRVRRDPALGVVLGILTALCYCGLPAGHPASAAAIRGGRPARSRSPRSARRSVAAGAGVVVGDLDLTPGLASLFWLAMLGVTSQSIGYLCISISLPRLPAVITSIILLVQPVLSVGLAMVLLGERPSPAQLVGVALVVGGIALATVPLARMRDAWRRRPERAAATSHRGGRARLDRTWTSPDPASRRSAAGRGCCSPSSIGVAVIGIVLIVAVARTWTRRTTALPAGERHRSRVAAAGGTRAQHRGLGNRAAVVASPPAFRMCRRHRDRRPRPGRRRVRVWPGRHPAGGASGPRSSSAARPTGYGLETLAV